MEYEYNMKKRVDRDADEMRAEYDLSKLNFVGRGIYTQQYRSGTNLVLLDSDVRKAFPDDKVINETLRCRKSKTPSRAREKIPASQGSVAFPTRSLVHLEEASLSTEEIATAR